MLTTIFYFLIGYDPQPSLFTDNYLQSVVIAGHFLESMFVLCQMNFMTFNLKRPYISMPFKYVLTPKRTTHYWKKIICTLCLLSCVVPIVLDLAFAQYSDASAFPRTAQVWVRLYHNVVWLVLNVHLVIDIAHFKRAVKEDSRQNKIANWQIWLGVVKCVVSLEPTYWFVSNFFILVSVLQQQQVYQAFNIVKNFWAFVWYIP